MMRITRLMLPTGSQTRRDGASHQPEIAKIPYGVKCAARC